MKEIIPNGNYSVIRKLSTANGEGLRNSIYLSGCKLHCKGCFNFEAWDFNAGKKVNEDTIKDLCDGMDYEDGISILGGEPMDIDNQRDTAYIIQEFKRFYPDKTIFLWTGYVLENLPRTEYTNYILENLDMVVDGPFIQDLYSPKLTNKGSSNQREILKD